ncbi:MAG: methionyl-tRNA formyltransferase [Chloroflexi bacterium]|nr:methionyl-tRNA formyltransferase [Chloroflexota bacterium]
MNPRVAFFGSPDFAVATLEALIDSPYRPIVVVTQPDRPAGRGRSLQPPPVKVVAERAGIAVLQPARLRDAEAVAELGAFRPELQIIVAYGQILPKAVLDIPQHGTINVHASLLPRWRGASPVQAAILAGDVETGVTIMSVDEGEDTGAILASRPEPIRSDDDAGSLSERLEAAGASLLLETIPRWLAGEITPIAQDDSFATRAPRIKKAAGQIAWGQPAEEIVRQVRAFSPWPGAFSELRGSVLRVWRASAKRGERSAPGTIVAAGDTIDVATGHGLLAIEVLQRAGKRAMPAAEFVHGERDLVGQRLGAPDG